jgi:hypothetical protein
VRCGGFPPEGLVDLQEHLFLALREGRVGVHRVGDGAGRPLFEDPGPHVQGLRGDAQAAGDLLQDLGRGLAQAALDLAQVGVADPGRPGQLPQRHLSELTLTADVLTDVLDLLADDLGHPLGGLLGRAHPLPPSDPSDATPEC